MTYDLSLVPGCSVRERGRHRRGGEEGIYCCHLLARNLFNGYLSGNAGYLSPLSCDSSHRLSIYSSRGSCFASFCLKHIYWTCSHLLFFSVSLRVAFFLGEEGRGEGGGGVRVINPGLILGNLSFVARLPGHGWCVLFLLSLLFSSALLVFAWSSRPTMKTPQPDSTFTGSTPLLPPNPSGTASTLPHVATDRHSTFRNRRL